MELLVVVVMLGIAAAIVIPQMSAAGSLRVQGVLRMMVADITLAQSDAVAFQAQRAVVFNYNGDPTRYAVAEVNGNAVDTATGLILERRFAGDKFGFSTMAANSLTDHTLVFDALGGPVDGPGGTNPTSTQTIDIHGSGQRWRINVEAYTGRVTLRSLD